MGCKWRCKARKCFSSFSYELGEEQEQTEQREEENEARLVYLGLGECHVLELANLNIRG